MADAILASSGIYAIRNKINGKVYIGSAVKTANRLSYHRSFLSREKHANSKLQRAWNRYGAGAFEFVVVESVAKHEDLIGREQYWIDELNAVDAGYNIRRIAQSNLGLKASPEARANMSKAQRGTKRHTPESKARLSLLKRGVPCHSEEARQRMRIDHKGRRHTDEAKAKIALASTGRSQSVETRKKRANALRATVAARAPYSPPPELRVQWSAAHKGRPAKNRKPVVLSGVEYVSIAAASLALGRNPQWVKARMDGSDWANRVVRPRTEMSDETRSKMSAWQKGISKPRKAKPSAAMP